MEIKLQRARAFEKYVCMVCATYTAELKIFVHDQDLPLLIHKFHPYNRKYPGITKGKTFRFPNMNILICLFFLVIQIVNVVECSEVGKTLLLFCMKNQNNKRIKHNMQGKIYKWKSKNKS